MYTFPSPAPSCKWLVNCHHTRIGFSPPVLGEVKMLVAVGNVTFLWLGKPLDIWRPEQTFAGQSNAASVHKYQLLTTNITTTSVIRTTPISINVGLSNFVWIQIFEMLGYANFVCVCVCVCVCLCVCKLWTNCYKIISCTRLSFCSAHCICPCAWQMEGTVVKCLRIAPENNEKRRSEWRSSGFGNEIFSSQKLFYFNLLVVCL